MSWSSEAKKLAKNEGQYLVKVYVSAKHVKDAGYGELTRWTTMTDERLNALMNAYDDGEPESLAGLRAAYAELDDTDPFSMGALLEAISRHLKATS